MSGGMIGSLSGSFRYRSLVGTRPVGRAQGLLPHLRGEGKVSQNCPCSLVGPSWACVLSPSCVCPPAPRPIHPQSPFLHRDCVPKASGLRRGGWGQWLCSVWYQPEREGVGLQDWGFNAIVFDFVTFPLGRVTPPSCSLACVPTPPPWLFPSHTPAPECGCVSVKSFSVR